METLTENRTYVAPEVKTIEVKLKSRLMQTSGNMTPLNGSEDGEW